MIEIEVFNGSGDFNICGAKDCTIFEFKGVTKFMIWEIDGNLLMNHIVGKIAEQPILYPETYQGLRENIERGTVTLKNIYDIFIPFLQNFASAKYRLSFIESEYFDVAFYPGVNTSYGPIVEASNSVWLGDAVVYGIQDSSNEKTVSHYVELIKKGIRPQIICFKSIESEIQLILEGCNKLKAYTLCKVKPQIIQITKVDNYAIKKHFILKAFDKLAKDNHLREILTSHLDWMKWK